MRASIRDTLAIDAIRPLNIIGYLRAHGWQKFSESAGKFSVWNHPSNPDAEVLIPASRDARDYVQQLREALQELEAVEDRSQLDILRDLYNSGFDVVRLAAHSPSTNDGTVKIEDGVQLFERARDILLAAACATVKPRAVFHSRKPQQANEYMRKARLGQTEHGSYVLTLLSPVAPQLSFHSDNDLFPEDPFERVVVQTLARAVGLTMAAAEKSATATKPDFEPFQQAVSGGVSANLCEGIAGFFATVEPTAIEMSVAWALNRPTPNEIPSRIRIGSDLVPTISEAARMFRAYDKLEGYELKGPVIKLERHEGEPTGWVTIFAPVEDVMRKVSILLPDAEYQLAVLAHASHRYVTVTGTVVREGRTYRLDSANRFELAVDDEDMD
jgi:hypothetical protein